MLNPADPIAAVAAAAVVAHAQGRAIVPSDALRWAADVLLEAAATRSHVDMMSSESMVYPWGADRSAAVALPALLLPPFKSLRLDRGTIERGLHSCATSLFDEVRVALVLGAAPVWAAPCEQARQSRVCRHRLAWAAARSGLRDCRLGDWNRETGDRLSEPLNEPYEDSLPTVETSHLLLNRLTAPLVVAAQAARSDSCVAGAAQRLLQILFAAHRRGLDHWAREDYALPAHHRQSVARVLIEAAIAGDVDSITNHIRLFVSNARALDHFLRDLAIVFTHDSTLRPALSTIWRRVMTTALDALDAGADLGSDRDWSDRALAGLLPAPRIGTSEGDPDRTWEEARQDWLAPDEIADLVARWLPRVRRTAEGLDAIALLAQCASPSWQGTTGLVWAEQLIDGEYAAVAGKCYFLGLWLEGLRKTGQLDSSGMGRWRHLVDRLAAAGDKNAVTLQQTEELARVP